MGEALAPFKGAVARACIFASLSISSSELRRSSEKALLGQRNPNEASASARLIFSSRRDLQLREAGTPWHEQGSRKRCAARALPRMAACAAVPCSTAVLARAEYFTLAPAGTTLELSDDGSWSTTSGPGSSG